MHPETPTASASLRSNLPRVALGSSGGSVENSLTERYILLETIPEPEKKLRSRPAMYCKFLKYYFESCEIGGTYFKNRTRNALRKLWLCLTICFFVKQESDGYNSCGNGSVPPSWRQWFDIDLHCWSWLRNTYILEIIGISCEVGAFLYIPWNVNHSFTSVENNHLAWFKCVDFGILLTLSLPTPGTSKCAFTTFWPEVRRRWVNTIPVVLHCVTQYSLTRILWFIEICMWHREIN